MGSTYTSVDIWLKLKLKLGLVDCKSSESQFNKNQQCNEGRKQGFKDFRGISTKSAAAGIVRPETKGFQGIAIVSNTVQPRSNLGQMITTRAMQVDDLDPRFVFCGRLLSFN